MKISQSQLSLYRNCPAAYKFKYIDGIEEVISDVSAEAMRFGTEFHENVVECKSNDILIKNMVSALHLSEFKEYINKITSKEDNIIIDVDDYQLRAIIDANCEDNILEFKTASKPWPKEKFETELQPVFYQFVEKQRTGKNKEFIYFVVTKNNKPSIQVYKIKELTKEKEEELLKLIKELKNDFEFKPKGYLNNGCMWCSFKDSCEVQF